LVCTIRELSLKVVTFKGAGHRGDDAEQGMGTNAPSVLDTELLRHRWTYR